MALCCGEIQSLLAMFIRFISRFCGALFALLALNLGLALPVHAQEVTIDSVFADAPFDKWKAEGPKVQIPWKVQLAADKLSIHQRLIATIQIQVPGTELLKRSHDGRILMFIQVTNGQGVSSRDYGILELDDLKPEAKHSDVEFSWEAFAVPGQYEVSVALWDKKSGEHNFMHRLFHVDAYKNDPLPGMWRGLDAFEFWAPKRDGPDYIFHSDIDGKLYLPLATKRPVELEVLLDLTPSAAIFRGNYGYYNRYISGALPIFKVFSQISVANGSERVAALDLVQRRIPFEQSDGKDLDWPSLSKALQPDNGPGVVSVKDLQNKRQSPVFLREEIVRRLSGPATQAGKQGEKPLHVFVVIGSLMDLYAFPSLPAVETGSGEDCIIYYLQFDFFEREQHRFHRYERFDPVNTDFLAPERASLTGAAGNLEKMLKPLKMRVLQFRTADEARHALATVMAELGKL
jgi:hypothetical protein